MTQGRGSTGSVRDLFQQLRVGWNSYDAPAPNDVALDAATVVDSMLSTAPDRVRPVADGGIAFHFWRTGRHASIECTNEGEVVFMLRRDSEEPAFASVPFPHDALGTELGKALAFLAS